MRQAARIAGLTIATLAGLLIIAEFTFRLVAGERLLYRADAAIEYLPRPSQSARQRGVLFETNEWGMRSPPLSRQKPEGVFRVLVLGDSVVFGHTNIDQTDLATTFLGALALDGRRIEALNVSAPSWGPGNLLAWVEANGLFGADAAMLVLSSHDLDDNRTFSPPDPDIYPQTQPMFALGDWIARRLRGSVADARSSDPRSSGDARRSLSPLFARISEAPAGACLIIHATVEERRSGGPSKQAVELSEIAAMEGLSVVQDRHMIDAAFGYADDIHLSMKGQGGLAAAMKACPALVGAVEDQLSHQEFQQ